MTPTVFVSLDTLTAHAALAGGDAAPDVRGALQALFACRFAFMSAAGETPEALTEPAFRFAIKNKFTGEPFAFTSAVALDEDFDDYPRYAVAVENLDAAALREALADFDEVEAVGEIEWTVDDERRRVRFPVIIANAVIRDTDGAPDPEADESDAFVAARAVCYDRAQDLTAGQKVQALANVGITGVKSMSIVRGCLRIVFENDDVAHAVLNSGEPPAL